MYFYDVRHVMSYDRQYPQTLNSTRARKIRKIKGEDEIQEKERNNFYFFSCFPNFLSLKSHIFPMIPPNFGFEYQEKKTVDNYFLGRGKILSEKYMPPAFGSSRWMATEPLIRKSQISLLVYQAGTKYLT